MRVFLLGLFIAAALLIAPFVFLRQPWAVRLWRQFRLALVLYVLLVIALAIANLVLRWDDFYG